ncbi:hypothetical protein SAMN04487981_1177 [Streptomyces sp. cf386]|nr:hypothetical protein SAMN04487981_1177 [Streptomyces sp. cf386]
MQPESRSETEAPLSTRELRIAFDGVDAKRGPGSHTGPADRPGGARATAAQGRGTRRPNRAAPVVPVARKETPVEA